MQKTIKGPKTHENGVNLWNIIKIIEPKKQPKSNPFFDEISKKTLEKIIFRKIEERKIDKKFIVGKKEIE